MPKETPKVHHNQLWLPHLAQPFCPIGSPAWFDWLHTAVSFRYFSCQTIHVAHTYYRSMAPISVRKEKRRRGFIWYANRRAFGQLHKRYVGTTTALTLAKLDDIALVLDLL